jgi:hypothetical protein
MSVNFLHVAKDDLRDCRGDESTAEYVADLLERLYYVDADFRQDINMQWDKMENDDG